MIDDILDSKPATNGKTTKSKLFLHSDPGNGLKKTKMGLRLKKGLKKELGIF